MSSVIRYDEQAIRAGLESMSPEARVLFAAACAERLIPLYELFSELTKRGDVSVLREGLKVAWSATDPGSVLREEIKRLRDVAEALVPDADDEDWSFSWAFAQTAAAAVTYALETWLSADAQNAVWASRQLYDVADFMVQEGASLHTYIEDIDENSPVQLALKGIEDALREAPELDVTAMRASAEDDGRALRAQVEQND